ncbi:MAG: DNA gyrase C-terminal beta-propeller domain-containing protein, partial [Gaiellales bacterium]
KLVVVTAGDHRGQAGRRTAGGVAGMRLAPGDRVVAACSVGPGDLVVLHEGGSGKRVEIADVPAKGRGGGGVALASPDKPAKEPAGPVAAIRCVDGPAGAILLSGQIAKVPAVEAANRAAVSRPLVETVVGDEVAGIA